LLKKGLANIDLMQVASRMTESPLNRDACVPVTLNALSLDPASVTGLMLIEKLHNMGASIPTESLTPVVARWEPGHHEHFDHTRPRCLRYNFVVMQNPENH